jgi:hypothetical protein
VLSLDYAARRGIAFGSNTFSVYWNDKKLADIAPNDYNKHSISWTIHGKLGANSVKLQGTGTSDSYGAGVTNIKLVEAGGNKNFIVNGDFTLGKAEGSWKIYTNNQITGWLPGPEIEVGLGQIYNSVWGGSQWISELDANKNTAITQTIKL